MILNLTQHTATPEQLAAGVVDLTPAKRAELQALLTFDQLPSRELIEERALAIVQMAYDAQPSHAWSRSAMIGGAPYLMAPLERELIRIGITPVYAFSTRESVEQIQADGSVRKVNVFRHAGWVPA